MVEIALVGSIGTVLAVNVVRKTGREVIDYAPQNLGFKKCDKIAYFKYGVTVVSLFEKNFGKIEPDFAENGQAIIGTKDGYLISCVSNKPEISQACLRANN